MDNLKDVLLEKAMVDSIESFAILVRVMALHLNCRLVVAQMTTATSTHEEAPLVSMAICTNRYPAYVSGSKRCGERIGVTQDIQIVVSPFLQMDSFLSEQALV